MLVAFSTTAQRGRETKLGSLRFLALPIISPNKANIGELQCPLWDVEIIETYITRKLMNANPLVFDTQAFTL